MRDKTTAEADEFRFLPEQAQALGVHVPSVKRVAVTLDDGRTLSALRFGDNDPEVTFLHGAGLNAHTWDSTALLLGRPALAIDLAGHGDSSWREDADYTPHRLAADVATALPYWASRPQVLVGQSLGGLTSAALAAAHPELTRSLLLIDIVPGLDTSAGLRALREFFSGPTVFSSREEVTDRALAYGLGGSKEDTARGVFFNTRVRADGQVEWKHHLALLIPQVFGTDETPSVRHENVWNDLDQIESPLTLVRALSGFVSSAAADNFAARLPAARVITVEASHNVQETAPAALATIIDETLLT